MWQKVRNTQVARDSLSILLVYGEMFILKDDGRWARRAAGIEEV